MQNKEKTSTSIPDLVTITSATYRLEMKEWTDLFN